MRERGINVDNSSAHMPMSEEQCVRAERILASVDFCDQELVIGLSFHHWLMRTKPSESLISVLTRYPPGSTLLDKDGRYWVK